MIITPAALQGIYMGFNTLFNEAFRGVEPQYTKVATVVPSTTDAETYAWLGDIPGMREWIGEREVHNLSSSAYTIRNKSFELTVSVPRDAVEDDKLGLYKPSVQMLGYSARRHPDKLIFGLLKDGFKTKCYDNKPFFADDHKVGEKKTASNKGTAPLAVDSYAAARAAIMSLTNSKGDPLGLVPDLLVVPPALEGAARKILQAEYIEGSSNIMRGTAELLVVPELAGADTAWYLLCTSMPLKPLIYQDRRPAKFVAKTGENEDNVFWAKEYVYGVDSRGNAGLGYWQMAYGSTGEGAAPAGR